MKIIFKPKFFLGEVRQIYLERMFKKALRVGAGEELVREAESLV